MSAAPLPYDWLTSSIAPAGGRFHLYLTDANGRKIAAIWGAPDQKEATAKLIVRATEAHAALVSALTIARRYVEADTREAPRVCAARVNLAAIDAALAKANAL